MRKKNLHPTEQFDICYTPLWKGHWTYLKTWNDVSLNPFINEDFGNAASSLYPSLNVGVVAS